MKQLAPALVALAVLLLGCRAPGSAPVTTAPATDATVQSLERQVEELKASASTIAPTQAAPPPPPLSCAYAYLRGRVADSSKRDADSRPDRTT